MKISMLMLTALVMMGCESANKDWTVDTPTFQDFKTSGPCKLSSKQRKPNFLDTDFSIAEKKEIREEYLAPDNYLNCRYSSSTISGQDDVWRHIVINTQSGEIIGELHSQSGITFSKQSALIILNPPDGIEDQKGTIEYWIIEEDHLKRIK